jgi:FkbM family methyltransferase
MLGSRTPQIYAFEPVAATFAKLQVSVNRLGLNDVVRAIPLALSDTPGTLRIALSSRNSLISRVVADQDACGMGDEQIVCARATTLDQFSAENGVQPTLIKMDIEGSEVAALRGARDVLLGEVRPSILFEHNPVALSKRGATPSCLSELLSGYEFYYVDDLQDQMLPFGSRIADLSRVQWICNLFAVPRGNSNAAKLRSAVVFARNELGMAESTA